MKILILIVWLIVGWSPPGNSTGWSVLYVFLSHLFEISYYMRHPWSNDFLSFFRASKFMLCALYFSLCTSRNTGGLCLFGKGGALPPRIYRFELNKRDIILTKSVRRISMVKNYGIDFQRLRTRSFHVSVFFGTGIPLWKFLTILFELYRWVRYKVQEGPAIRYKKGSTTRYNHPFFIYVQKGPSIR